ncbi:hypothetical protein QBC42DRAFT_261307 [Cladorrhinum samala]|uniref:Uncharacterized protein n=1 Tax=Cladorrhinum samala TaxID=585594 RepID=A0AAV9I297_9PEZI|nr:hypothetical protein QBC42DRAFT_261307 [Cladorrhinum samala]
MGENDKAIISHSENVSEKPRRRGCVGHCVKFWWAYLILLIVVVVVVVPVVLLVAVPKMAQHKLDEAELILDGITVTNTKTGSMTMAINSTIKSDGKVKANIDPFIGDMYLEDLEPHTPFARINFPATTADKLQTVNVTQEIEIADAHALTTFNQWLLANETLRVTVKGKTHVKVSGISKKYSVTFKKTIEMPGLMHLDGTIVNQTTISLENDELGNNFRGQAYIPNRSLVSFELGNVTFHNYLLGAEVGTVFIDNLFVRAGEVNQYLMRATIENGPVLNALGAHPYCDETKGVLPFQIRGKTVVNHGQDLNYFRDALSTYNQTVEIDIGGTLQKSVGITIPCGGLGGGDNHS